MFVGVGGVDEVVVFGFYYEVAKLWQLLWCHAFSFYALPLLGCCEMYLERPRSIGRGQSQLDMMI